MNLPKRKTVFMAAYIAVACLAHIVLFRNKVNTDIPVIFRLLSALAAIAITLLLHELIHGFFMKLLGMKNVKIQFAKDRTGLPSLRTAADGQLFGAKRILVLMAPFVLLTVIPDVIFVFSNRVELFFFIAAVCNAAGCCFDVMDVLNLQS